MKKWLIIFLFSASTCFAAEDFYSFQSGVERDRFESLTTTLRCLVCQNQNLAESNATLANDLRDEIYRQMQKGQSNQQIIDYLISRYGDFILYQPPLNSFTWGLWFGPFVLLFLSIGFLFYYVRRHKRE